MPLDLSVTRTTLRTGTVPNAHGARQGLKGPKIGRKNRGRIYLVVFTKVCPVLLLGVKTQELDADARLAVVPFT